MTEVMALRIGVNQTENQTTTRSKHDKPRRNRRGLLRVIRGVDQDCRGDTASLTLALVLRKLAPAGGPLKAAAHEL